jgi:hypothetical protein
MALRLDFECVEIDERFAVVIFGPGDTDNERLFRCYQLRVAGRRVPFAHDLRAEPFLVKEVTKHRDRILVRAVPVLPEIIPLEELFKSPNPFHLHRGHTFYLKSNASNMAE